MGNGQRRYTRRDPSTLMELIQESRGAVESLVVLTPRQVARLLKVSESTLDRDRVDGFLGGIPYFTVGGVVRYRASDVKRFVVQQRSLFR